MHNALRNNQCLSCGKLNEPWIIDSDATNHMIHNKDFFVHLRSLKQPFDVLLPNGSKVKVVSCGTVLFASNLILQNVLYVPQLHFNLISIEKLLKDLRCSLLFITSCCNLQGPSVKEPQVLGKVQGGLNFLQIEFREKSRVVVVLSVLPLKSFVLVSFFVHLVFVTLFQNKILSTLYCGTIDLVIFLLTKFVLLIMAVI